MERKFTVQKYFLLLIICLIFGGQIYAKTYYVDNNSGNDLNDGLTTKTAWATLSKINSFSFSANDSILFKRNCIWRGQLIPKSGTMSGYITYADYGIGKKPLLLGSVNVSDTNNWVNEGGNIWQSAQSSSVDIGNLIFNEATNFGVKKWAVSQLTNQGDFWWDKTGTKTVQIYSSINPASYYSDIEAAIGNFIVYMQSDSFIVLHNLDFKYGAADCIEVRNTHHITIMDCDLSYIGGTELTTQVRYGGGVQFWANCHDDTVERCKIGEIYDDGLTNQGNVSAGGTVQQYNLVYLNNFIWNCSESSFCYFIQPAIILGSFMKNIYFENNTCVNAGGGWAASQRPDLKGFQIYCSANTAPTDSIFIRNNILYQSRCIFFVDNSSVHTQLFTTMDYNCWHTTNMADTIVAFWTSDSLNVWTTSQFSSYQIENNQDQHSFFADPLFVNYSTADFHLTKNSPCIHSGLSINNSRDIDFEIRNIDSIDIGADQYYPITWIGAISSDWSDINNWSTGRVPSISDDVVINAGSLFNPMVYSGIVGTCSSIKVNNGAALIVATGGKLNISQ